MQLRLKRAAPVLHLAFAMSSRASDQIVALLVTLVAVARLSPSEFGVFALASAFVIIVRTLLYSGTFQYLLKAPDLRDCSSECLIVSLAMAGVMTLVPAIVLVAADPFGDPAVLSLFLILMPSNLIAAVGAWQEAQILRGSTLTRYYAITGGIEIGVGLLTILLLILHFSVFALVVQVYARALALLVAYGFLQRPVLSAAISIRRTGEVARWALPQYGAMLASLLSNYGGDFIVGAVLSPAAAGIYRAASRVSAAAADICAQPMRTIAMTAFSGRAARGLPSNDLWPQVAGLTLLLAATALGGLAAIAPTAMPALFGQRWAGIEQVVMILCIGRGAAALAGVTTPLLIAYGRHQVLLPVQAACTAAMLIGLLVLAPYGLAVTAWVTTAALSAGAMAYLVLAFRTAPPDRAIWPDHLRAAMMPAVVSTLVAAILVHRLPGGIEGVARPVVAMLAAALAWLLAVWVERRRVIPMLAVVRHRPEASG